MSTFQNISLPHFVLFEGVDGSGKTTLAHALASYYRHTIADRSLFTGAFPGTTPGTLGEWVYRLHHSQLPEKLSPTTIAPAALQLLHVAAHIDTILMHIAPTLQSEGYVILDRYWWSTYSYSRLSLPVEQAWSLVHTERFFLTHLPQPIIVYLTRSKSLKEDEISTTEHIQLDSYYRELIDDERSHHVPVYEINNDGPIGQTWTTLLAILGLPYQPLTN